MHYLLKLGEEMMAKMQRIEVSGIEQLGKSTGELPIGTILPSVLPPKAFLKYAIPKDGWLLANGDALPNQKSPLAVFMKLNDDSWYDNAMVKNDVAYTPNLHGSFLRGIDEQTGSSRDPDGVRKIGNYQGDSLGKHSHSCGQQTQAIVHYQGDVFVRPNGDQFTTGPAGGDETRPKNIAVYFYVRVA